MNPPDVVDPQEFLSNLSEKIQEADTKLKGLETKLETKRTELRNFSSDKLDTIQSLDYKRIDLESKISELDSRLKSINKEIADRQIYLLDQETTINRVMTEWNEQLSAIRTEVSIVETNRTRLLKEIVRHEQKRDDLAVELEQLGDRKITLEASYEERAKDYRARLQQLDRQLAEKTNQNNEMELANEIRDKSLKARENAIAINEVVVSRNKEELEQKERKLRLDYRLAGKDYS